MTECSLPTRWVAHPDPNKDNATPTYLIQCSVSPQGRTHGLAIYSEGLERLDAKVPTTLNHNRKENRQTVCSFLLLEAMLSESPINAGRCGGGEMPAVAFETQIKEKHFFNMNKHRGTKKETNTQNYF